MFRQNSLLIGFAIGVTVPVLGYILLESLFGALGSLGVTTPSGDPIRFKERTMALLAICCNLLPFWRFNTRFTEATMRGILVATAVCVIGWFVTFGRALLSGELN